MEVATQNLRTFENEKIEKVKKLDNGIAIKWLVDQKGRTIKDGEMVLIEYRLSLPDGKIVAGNNPNMPFMPFVVGYNMQTLGWDIAFKELSVGDFAKIELPASFAYGSKGIKDVIPANSKVWLFVKIYSYIEPGLNKNGVKSWLVKQGEKMASDTQNNLEYTIQMTVSSKTRSNIVNTYFNNAPLMYTRGQRNLLPGLRNLVDSSRKGDRFLVLLAPEKGFGPNGFSDKISSQDTILVNMEIEDVRGI
jgi:FK506-binding protein 1